MKLAAPSSLTAAVETHERLHSTLARDAIIDDPAKKVESSLSMDRLVLKQNANGYVQKVNSDMILANDESNVIAKMPTQFRPGGCIDFPAWGSAARGGCYYFFASFADKDEKMAN